MGDAPAAWMVDYSLVASGENQIESPASSDFTRVGIPAGLDDADHEFEHKEGHKPNFIGYPSTSLIGREGRIERGTCQETPKKEERSVRMRNPPVHLRDYQCCRITVTDCSAKIQSRMAGRSIVFRTTSSRSFQCEKELQRSFSLRRHLLEQHRVVPKQRGVECTETFGLTADQSRIVG